MGDFGVYDEFRYSGDRREIGDFCNLDDIGDEHYSSLLIGDDFCIKVEALLPLSRFASFSKSDSQCF